VHGITQVQFIQGDLAEALNLPSSGGLLIETIDSGSPADEAGLRGYDRIVIVGMNRLGVGGDLITAIDGVAVEGQDSLRRAVNRKKAGDRLELTIIRGRRTMKVTLTLGSAAEAL
jgi:S1-C subfamily serine protease